MKKIFTLIAVAMMALGVNAQTNFEANPEGLNPVPAGTVLTDNEFFKATTVFEAGGGSNTRTYTKDITFRNNLSVEGDILSKGRIYQRTTLSYDLKGATDGSIIEIDDLAKEYLIKPGNNSSAPLAVYSLTATWQANN